MITNWILKQWWSSNITIFCLLLSPISFLYRFITVIRRWAYKRNLLLCTSANAPVIIVGNIIVGGAGKTPVVIALTKHFQSQGIKVAVLSRGYGVKIIGNQPLVISGSPNNDRDCHYASNIPDEPVLIHAKTSAKVYCHPNRVLSAEVAVKDGAELLICDDGLQHYALRRDIEVVIHPRNPAVGNGFHLPAGPLRESISRANSATYQLSIDKLSSQKFQNSTQYNFVPTKLTNAITSDMVAVDDFSFKNTLAFAGIARPSNFFDTLRECQIQVDREIAFPDHFSFTADDIVEEIDTFVVHNALSLGSDIHCIMTEKDYVKCQTFLGSIVTNNKDHNIHFWVLAMEVVFPEPFLENLSDRVSQLLEKPYQ
jgi:tetraacyldisaccharide 4'-kinase